MEREKKKEKKRKMREYRKENNMKWLKRVILDDDKK